MDAHADPRPVEPAERPGRYVVLIVSPDPIAAALLGGLIETLGYLVRFYQPPEPPEAAIRRVRPAVAMLGCDDPSMITEHLLGRTRMRGVSVIIFGSHEAVGRVRQMATTHELTPLLLPADIGEVDEVLRKAIEKVC